MALCHDHMICVILSCVIF